MTKNMTKPKQTLANMLISDGFKKQMALALPKHLTPDRFTRIALTEIRKNPELAKCDQASFLGAIIQCAQLGVEPGDSLGRAYLIPFENRKKGIKECQLIIGYRGLLDLARRSGTINSISAHCVYENDLFDFEYGLEEKLRHVPNRDNRGNVIAVYGIAKFKDGGYQFEVMFKNAIDKIRGTSKSASSSYSPWSTNYEEMARKTVLRRLCKFLPCSVELQQAVSLDELADLGKQDFDSNVIDVSSFQDEVVEPENLHQDVNENPSMTKAINEMKDKLSEKN